MTFHDIELTDSTGKADSFTRIRHAFAAHDVVNLKAAKQIGLPIPPNVLARADRVINQAKAVRRKMHKFVLAALLLALSFPVHAQQPTKILRIGYLDSSTASGSAVLVNAFRQELSKLGWIEGKNINIEYRFAEQKNERLPELARDLVRLKVELIVISGTAPALVPKSATTTIPIVMTNIGDPVGAGLVASLARPGGNVTGLSSLSPELIQKGWRYLKTRYPISPELDFCGWEAA